jgi:hypothetical protein
MDTGGAKIGEGVSRSIPNWIYRDLRTGGVPPAGARTFLSDGEFWDPRVHGKAATGLLYDTIILSSRLISGSGPGPGEAEERLR